MQRSMVTLLGLAFTALVIALFQLSTRVSTLESEQQARGNVKISTVPIKPVLPRGDLSQLEKATITLFEQRSASVVHITSLEVRADPFRRNALEVPRGTGSGFIWDEAGHVVTNFHVIQGASAARVTLSDQSVWEAKLVGASPRNDLAVLRIEADKGLLRPIELGASGDLRVGQQVFAIGSPFGLDYTLSTGIISGLGREIPSVLGLPIQGAIQTDAAINPGNSGGPLLDSSGRLIGVNTSILSPSGASAGIGFAVPADIVARAIPQLIKYGRDVRPTIGVELADDALAQRFGLQGALVLNVVPGSPAEKAALNPTQRDGRSGRILLGDVIVSLDGAPINKTADLYLALEKHKQGDRVKLGLIYAGAQREVEIELTSNVTEP